MDIVWLWRSRRRQRPAPIPRELHSNAQTEQKLRRIEAIYLIIAGQRGQIEDFRDQIDRRNCAALKLREIAAGALHPSIRDACIGQATAHEGYVDYLLGEIRKLEGSILGYHDAIETISEGLDEDALRLLASPDPPAQR